MSRFARTILILALVFTGGVMVSHSQEDMVVVDNQSFSNPQRSPALFPHDAHNEKAGIEDCTECHHVYENGVKQENESSEDRSCSDCHASVDEGNTPGLMKAFHRNCKGCHETQKKGPVMCGECHPWR